VPARLVSVTGVAVPDRLAEVARHRLETTSGAISARQGVWFDEQKDKLDRWAEDKRAGSERISVSTMRI